MPGSLSQQYHEALQGSQAPAMDVMQHMAHMQALLAGATSASLQVSLSFSFPSEGPLIDMLLF